MARLNSCQLAAKRDLVQKAVEVGGMRENASRSAGLSLGLQGVLSVHVTSFTSWRTRSEQGRLRRIVKRKVEVNPTTGTVRALDRRMTEEGVTPNAGCKGELPPYPPEYLAPLTRTALLKDVAGNRARLARRS